MCIACVHKNPDIRAARGKAIRNAYRAKPELAAKQRKHLTRHNRSKAMRKLTAKVNKRDRKWEGALAAITPEDRVKMARGISEAKLAHIPRDQRGLYRELIYRKRIPADEAFAIVMEHHELAMAKFRRELGEE